MLHLHGQQHSFSCLSAKIKEEKKWTAAGGDYKSLMVWKVHVQSLEENQFKILNIQFVIIKRDFPTFIFSIIRGNQLTLGILLCRSLEELVYSTSLQFCFHWHARSLTTSEALTPLERILSIPRGDAFERTDVLRLKRPPTQTATLLPLYICSRSINNYSQ